MSGGRPLNGPELTSFVGRRRELERIRSALRAARLLTLTGPGGVGKTRLAWRAMAQLGPAFPDGILPVELAGISNPSLVAQSAAVALDLRDDSGRWPVAMLADRLRDRRCLLFLDNCEHVLEAAAVLADALLGECPGLRILATSRQPLGVPGEVALPVPSLSLPTDEPGGPSRAVAASEAVRLFVDRASAASPGFALDAAGAETVAALCRRLDGIPLAIELAAVRIRGLSPDELLEHLDHRLGLLTTGSRAAMPRQRTLRATIDWSHGLLTGTEAVVWRRLSVFPADFPLEAATAVAGGSGVAPADVPATLADLVDKSMAAHEGGRYRLLESLREYAGERLAASDERDAVSRRLRDWSRSLTARVAVEGGGARQRAAFDAVAMEHANVRAALEWCRNEPGEAAAGLRLASDLWLYWQARGHIGEGRRWLRDLLEGHPEDDPVRARALWVSGHLALAQRDVEAARPLLLRSAELAATLGDEAELAFARQYLGLAALFAGDLSGAAELLEAAVAAHGAADAPAGAFATADLAIVTSLRGDTSGATRLFEASLHWSERSGDRWSRAHALWGLGLLAWRDDRPVEGAELMRESLELMRDLDERTGIALCVEVLAWIASLRDARRAAHLVGASQAVWESIPSTLPDMLRADREASERRIRGALAPADHQAAHRAGAALDLDTAVAAALEQPLPQPSGVLTRREAEVARLVAAGRTDREVATQLVISIRTAETHVSRILGKLGLRSRTELAAVWKEREAGAGQ